MDTPLYCIRITGPAALRGEMAAMVENPYCSVFAYSTTTHIVFAQKAAAVETLAKIGKQFRRAHPETEITDGTLTCGNLRAVIEIY